LGNAPAHGAGANDGDFGKCESHSGCLQITGSQTVKGQSVR
jgi:hypothetical protein